MNQKEASKKSRCGAALVRYCFKSSLIARKSRCFFPVLNVPIRNIVHENENNDDDNDENQTVLYLCKCIEDASTLYFFFFHLSYYSFSILRLPYFISNWRYRLGNAAIKCISKPVGGCFVWWSFQTRRRQSVLRFLYGSFTHDHIVIGLLVSCLIILLPSITTFSTYIDNVRKLVSPPCHHHSSGNSFTRS